MSERTKNWLWLWYKVLTQFAVDRYKLIRTLCTASKSLNYLDDNYSHYVVVPKCCEEFNYCCRFELTDKKPKRGRGWSIGTFLKDNETFDHLERK